MINQRTIFEIHRLANDGLSVHQIALSLGIDRRSVTSTSPLSSAPR
jgi:DNA-binding NarL/FixJ family response regulator